MKEKIRCHMCFGMSHVLFNLLALRVSMVCCALLFSSESMTQSYYFRHYQVENGLSNNTVFSCIQDRDGFVWMATKDGLNRFNGYDFEVFRSLSGDSTAGDGYIRSLYLDHDNILYAGTRTGIYCFKKEKEKFEKILYTGQETNALKKDFQGNLWVISNQHLIRITSHHTFYRYQFKVHNTITAICIDSSKQVWVSSGDGVVRKWDSYNDSFSLVNLFAGAQDTSLTWIEKMVTDKNGKIWIGTSNEGAILFDPRTLARKKINFKEQWLRHVYIRDFLQVSDDEIWMATEKGIIIYNSRSGTYTNVTKQLGDRYSLSDNAVYCLNKDREGGVWAGTYFGGINYYHKQFSVFEKYSQENRISGLSGNVVREICPSPDGKIWIGTEDGGLNLLDTRHNNIRKFAPYAGNSGLSYNNIHGLLVCGNNLLIGTFEHGMDIMDIKSKKVIDHLPKKNIKDHPKSNFFVTFLKTRDYKIYSGTRYGLYEINLASKRINNVAPVLTNAFIDILMEAADRSIWIGTIGNGLYKYNPKNNQIVQIPLYHASDRSAINWITTLCQDVDGNIWIGTEGDGLLEYLPNQNKTRFFSIENGWPSNSVYKIIQDKQQQLWISTAKGLISFNPHNQHIDNIYTTANGLLSDQFNYNSGYQDENGNIFLGTVKGMIRFNPRQITRSTFDPPIFITTLVANGQPIVPNNAASLLFSDSICLTNKQSSFSIGFAALSFLAPEKIRYRYKMIGLGSDWQYLNGNHSIYFSQLSPGKYTFIVQATRPDNSWGTHVASIHITLFPTFWQSCWAYLLYTIVLLIIVFMIVRSYHLMMVEKNKRKLVLIEHGKEKELYKTKIDFLVNFAHEIRTPLTLIKAPLERIKQQTENFPQLKKNVSLMERNTERIINLSEELLDFRKVEVDAFKLQLTPVDIVAFSNNILETFGENAENKNIVLHKIFPLHPVMALIDKEAFQKIMANLIGNAIKYADSFIEIAIHTIEKKEVAISLKNDGNKIPAEMKDKIFEAFFRLESSKTISGTGLGLTLSKSLAILQNGHLQCVVSDPEYNIFELILPLR